MQKTELLLKNQQVQTRLIHKTFNWFKAKHGNNWGSDHDFLIQRNARWLLPYGPTSNLGFNIRRITLR